MIEIDTEVLKTKSLKLENLNLSYNQKIDNFFTRIGHMPSETGEWVGTTASRFIFLSAVDNLQYNNLSKTLTSYSKYLQNSAEKIDNLCKEIRRK